MAILQKHRPPGRRSRRAQSGPRRLSFSLSRAPNPRITADYTETGYPPCPRCLAFDCLNTRCKERGHRGGNPRTARSRERRAIRPNRDSAAVTNSIPSGLLTRDPVDCLRHPAKPVSCSAHPLLFPTPMSWCSEAKPRRRRHRLRHHLNPAVAVLPRLECAPIDRLRRRQLSLVSHIPADSLTAPAGAA